MVGSAANVVRRVYWGGCLEPERANGGVADVSDVDKRQRRGGRVVGDGAQGGEIAVCCEGEAFEGGGGQQRVRHRRGTHGLRVVAGVGVERLYHIAGRGGVRGDRGPDVREQRACEDAQRFRGCRDVRGGG